MEATTSQFAIDIGAAPTLNPALKEFWTAKGYDGRVLYGGRASSKSWDAAGFLVYLADNFQIKVVCARQFQNRIEDSVYSLLKIQIERFGLGHRFLIQKNKIISRVTGSVFVFYGLWRSIDEIKSLEGIDILWIEEAHHLTEEQWRVLEPTIRKAFSQVWLIFNPRFATDFVYKRFVVNPPPGFLLRQINYDENPFLSEKMLRTISAARDEDEGEYRHIYLGQAKDNDESVIIKRRWIMAAVDANFRLQRQVRGSKRIGFDIADDGEDKCAEVYAHGFHVSWAKEWKGAEDELLRSCTISHSDAADYDASIIWDGIGVGAAAGAQFNVLNGRPGAKKIAHAKFIAGGAVVRPEAEYSPGRKNKDMFKNVKAQAWWGVADRFRNTYNAVHRGQEFSDDQIISISSACPHLEKMIDELATPKREYDENGLVKVESKKDLANPKREGGAVPSPNLADAFIMAFAPSAAAVSFTQDSIKALQAAVGAR